jgi:chaperonin GroES
MKRKDMLAAGARSATFAGGVGDSDPLRNVAPEGSRDETVVAVDRPKTIRQKFTPLKNVLLVRRSEVVNNSILITDNIEKEKPAEGEVLEAGEGVGYDYGIQIGDRVVFGKYAGAEFRLNGETLLLMEADEIKGILSNETIN